MDQGNTKGDREQSVCEMEQKFQAAYRNNQQARIRLREYMLRVVRNAAAGDGSMALSNLPSPDSVKTWGTTYCNAIKALAPHVPYLSTGLTDADSLADGAPNGLVPGGDEPVDTSLPPPGEPGAGAQPDVFNPLAFDPNSFGALHPQSLGELITGRITEGMHEIGLSETIMNGFAVEIHKKFSLAGACVVFVLIGVPFALRFPRGGVGLVIGVSLVIFAISYVGLIAGEGLAKGGKMSPFIAMWAANFLLAAVGVALLVRMGRESTSRGTTIAAAFDEFRDWLSRVRPGKKR
jgi:lipopolysaccharide export system permease protein